MLINMLAFIVVVFVLLTKTLRWRITRTASQRDIVHHLL